MPNTNWNGYNQRSVETKFSDNVCAILAALVMSEGVEPPPPMPYVSIGALRELTHVVADSEAQCPNLRVVNAWATSCIGCGVQVSPLLRHILRQL